MIAAKNITSWRVIQNSIVSCSMKTFNFAYVNEIFINITKIIYVDMKKKTIFQNHLTKLSINIDKLC